MVNRENQRTITASTSVRPSTSQSMGGNLGKCLFEKMRWWTAQVREKANSGESKKQKITGKEN